MLMRQNSCPQELGDGVGPGLGCDQGEQLKPICFPLIESPASHCCGWVWRGGGGSHLSEGAGAELEMVVEAVWASHSLFSAGAFGLIFFLTWGRGGPSSHPESQPHSPWQV